MSEKSVSGVTLRVALTALSRDRLQSMTSIQVSLQERGFDELVEHSARLAQADDEMRWALIQARKEAGLSQRDVAEMMGVKQPTVAAFESQDNDPRLSTLRRYALAAPKIGRASCRERV